MPRMPTTPPARALSLALVLALAGGCGPSPREASIALLVAAVGIVVLANFHVWVLWLLWRRVRPELGFRWRPFVEVGLGLSALGLVAEAIPYDGRMSEWLGVALWIGGTSYLTLFLLVWRIRLTAPKGLAWAHAIAGSVIGLPALPLAFVGSTRDGLPDVLLFLWFVPGYLGLASGALHAVLLLEALLRWRKARASGAGAVASREP